MPTTAKTGELAGKVAFVTGAARGQGAAHARLMAAEGARVLLTDVLDDLGRAVVDEITSSGGEAAYRHLDVRSTTGWSEVTTSIEREWGRIDILVNNAGVVSFDSVEDISDDEWDRVLATNLGGCYKGMRAVIPALRRAGGGAIVNVSSVFGITATPGYAAYVSSKTAIIGLTKSAALTVGQDRIRVNAVAPGSVDTPMLDEVKAYLSTNPLFSLADMVGGLPVPRIGTPEEVAELVLFLVSDRSRYTTGVVYPVDGGQLAGA